jgi:23S rRNA pseudouridine1911/1915/1917 synthase
MSEPAEPEVLRLSIGPDLQGKRADDAVRRGLPGFSRKELEDLFDTGKVRVAGRPLKKGDRVLLGQELVLEAPTRPITPAPGLPLSILFESEDFVIVDKPAGLPTAPLSRSDAVSLAAGLLARYPEMEGVGFRPREPGLVHRLDTETSGVVLAARSGSAFAAARSAFESAAFEKRYRAIVGKGLVGSGEIETWLGPDPGDARRVKVFEQAPDAYAKRCRTRYRVLAEGGGFALVELDVERAFRHQIRAHLAHRGYPIAGDAVYGGPVAPTLGARHALHASYIAWAGDAERAGFRAEAGLPEELRALLDGAGGG